MRVLMMHTHDLGIGHYRMWAPAKALQTAGYDVTFFSSPNGRGDALLGINAKFGDPVQWLFKHVKDYDLVHWGYSTMIHHVELAVALRNAAGVPFITDYDDDLYNVPPYNMAFKQYHPGAPERRVVRLGIRVADSVSVSTPSLRDVFAAANDARKIHFLPNLHDPSVWNGLEVDPARSRDESIRLMFSGGLGRFGDLSVPDVRDAIESVMAKFDGNGGRPMLRLFFIGCGPDWAGKWMQDPLDPTANRAFFCKFAPLDTYFRIWKWISPDIVINPVQENVFNASKSAIKAFEAGAVGAAFVGTDWPTHNAIPKDCMLKVSNTRAQWAESLEELITNDAMRHKLAGKLSKWVDTQTYANHIHHWVQAYESAIESGAMNEDDLYRVLHKAPEGVVSADNIGRVDLSHPVPTQ